MELEIDSRSSGALREAIIEWAKEGKLDEPEEPKPLESPDVSSFLDSIPARPHSKYTSTTVVKIGHNPSEKQFDLAEAAESVFRGESLRARATKMAIIGNGKSGKTRLIVSHETKKREKKEEPVEPPNETQDRCDHAVCSKYCQGCRHKLFYIKPTTFVLQEKPKTCVRCRSVFFSDMRVCVECPAARADQPPSQNATEH